MKGVILAGGTGSRMYPLTKVTNKCLLPMGRKPMIVHILDVLLKGDITDVMLVTGPEHMGAVVALLGSGKEYGCRMTYRVQDEANGIAAALGMCEDFIGDDKFAVILGDNIFENVDEPAAGIRKFGASDDDFGLFIKKVPDPQRFGVMVYRGNSMVGIIEKPTEPPSDDAVLGLYLYSPFVFDIIRELKPSARGEYEISDVNNEMVRNEAGEAHRVECGWVDAGTHDSYERACDMMRKKGTT